MSPNVCTAPVVIALPAIRTSTPTRMFDNRTKLSLQPFAIRTPNPGLRLPLTRLFA